MKRIKIGWAFIAISLLWNCSKENDDLGTVPASINDNVWQLVSKSENNQESRYPVTVNGDFDNDKAEETLARNDFYIFEDGWVFCAYSYAVINHTSKSGRTPFCRCCIALYAKQRKHFGFS